MPDSVRFERQKLWEEVWATPMWKLCKKYALSGRGLAKICARLGVPVPPRGYWRQKQSGQPVAPTPLPPLGQGQRDFVDHLATAAEPQSTRTIRIREASGEPNHGCPCTLRTSSVGGDRPRRTRQSERKRSRHRSERCWMVRGNPSEQVSCRQGFVPS